MKDALFKNNCFEKCQKCLFKKFENIHWLKQFKRLKKIFSNKFFFRSNLKKNSF